LFVVCCFLLLLLLSFVVVVVVVVAAATAAAVAVAVAVVVSLSLCRCCCRCRRRRCCVLCCVVVFILCCCCRIYILSYLKNVWRTRDFVILYRDVLVHKAHYLTVLRSSVIMMLSAITDFLSKCFPGFSWAIIFRWRFFVGSDWLKNITICRSCRIRAG